MVKACCSCKYQSMRADGIKMHRFPSDPEFRKQWVTAMNKENFTLTHTHVICSRHFTPECYKLNKKKNLSLKKDAVPSIFGDQLPEVQRCGNHFTQIEQIDDSDPDDCETSMGHIVDSNVIVEAVHYQDAPNECIIIQIVDEPGDQVGSSEECKNDNDNNEPTSTTTTEELERILAGDNDNYEMDVDTEEVIETTGNEIPSSTTYKIEIVDEEEQPNKEEVKPETRNIYGTRKQPHFVGDFIFEDLFDEVQSKKYWAMSHKVIDEQKKKLRFCSTKIRQLEKRVRTLNNTISELQERNRKKIVIKRKQKLIYTTEGCLTL